jgi:hypothetical protein
MAARVLLACVLALAGLAAALPGGASTTDAVLAALGEPASGYKCAAPLAGTTGATTKWGSLIPGIPNLREVARGVYRGVRPNKESLQALKKAGIRTVISLQGGGRKLLDADRLLNGETHKSIDEERRVVQSLGMTFINVPLSSFRSVDKKAQDAIRLVHRTMADPNSQPVYLHCKHGVDRTGLISALFRVSCMGWQVSRARKEWRDLGHKGLQRDLTMFNMDNFFDERAATWTFPGSSDACPALRKC